MNLKKGGVELLNPFPLNSSHEQIFKTYFVTLFF